MNAQPNDEQYMRALQRANAVRLERARVKREVAAGTRTAASVVRECSWCTETMALSELLMSQRRWGRTRTRRILLSLGLPENKQLGTLTPRQQDALAEALDRRPPGNAA